MINKKVPHVVQYQGSKRLLAPQILKYVPSKFNRLIEPFAGMAAMTVAVATDNRTSRFHVNDLNAPLVALLREVIEHPIELVDEYTKIWNEQHVFKDGHIQHYYAVRDEFNEGIESPARMLYLLARCVKGSVRYSRNGKFNQSPDNRRHGTSPFTLKGNVLQVSQLLKGKTTFSSLDYKSVLDMAQPGDLVYMDPPYQGVTNTRDHRYFAGVDFSEFVDSIRLLNTRGIDYIISYDGACGSKEYGEELPTNLNCHKIFLNAGLSSQAILLGKHSTTFESLYISSSLMYASRSALEQIPLFESIYE